MDIILITIIMNIRFYQPNGTYHKLYFKILKTLFCNLKNVIFMSVSFKPYIILLFIIYACNRVTIQIPMSPCQGHFVIILLSYCIHTHNLHYDLRV